MTLSRAKILSFRRKIYSYYQKSGRRFPWRETKDPYKILVSEMMLQQTQTGRVVPFFTSFIKRFPDFKTLAHAPHASVLGMWQGLGYNRRALNLQHAAERVIRDYRGILPRDSKLLDDLPGVGAYTASAVAVFAWNKPEALIETNIRSVYLHFFFENRRRVPDREVAEIAQRALDTRNPRKWHQALMDYGAMLKRTSGNANVRSSHYIKQEPFTGSRRQIRGAIIKLALKNSVTSSDLKKLRGEYKVSLSVVSSALDNLVAEGFLKKGKESFSLC